MTHLIVLALGCALLLWGLERWRCYRAFWQGPYLRQQLDRWRDNGEGTIPPATLPAIKPLTVVRRKRPTTRKVSTTPTPFTRKKA